MRTPFYLPALVGVLALVAALPWAQADELRRYGLESGMVEYKLAGMQTGKAVLYFDSWGAREAKYTQSETRVLNRFVQKTNTVAIIEGDFTITIDLDNQTGTKIPTPLLPQLRKRTEETGKSLTDLGEEMLVAMGGRKVGQEQFLGKACDAWEMKNVGTRMLVYKSVPLKTATHFAGQSLSIEATKFEENAQVPADKLAVPAGVKIEEGKNPLDTLRELREKTRSKIPLPPRP